MSTVLTTVRGHFNGHHVDPVSGVLHGHDYVVEATWRYNGKRFEARKTQLDLLLASLDHERLPDNIWAAEDLAVWLRKRLGCVWIKVARPVIGHSVVVGR